MYLIDIIDVTGEPDIITQIIDQQKITLMLPKKIKPGTRVMWDAADSIKGKGRIIYPAIFLYRSHLLSYSFVQKKNINLWMVKFQGNEMLMMPDSLNFRLPTPEEEATINWETLEYEMPM